VNQGTAAMTGKWVVVRMEGESWREGREGHQVTKLKKKRDRERTESIACGLVESLRVGC